MKTAARRLCVLVPLAHPGAQSLSRLVDCQQHLGRADMLSSLSQISQQPTQVVGCLLNASYLACPLPLFGFDFLQNGNQLHDLCYHLLLGHGHHPLSAAFSSAHRPEPLRRRAMHRFERGSEHRLLPITEPLLYGLLSLDRYQLNPSHSRLWGVMCVLCLDVTCAR